MDPCDLLPLALSRISLQAEEEKSQSPQVPTNESIEPTNAKRPQPATFTTLPAELRLIIYSHATDNHLGTSLVQQNSGRLQFRLAWPLSPLEYRSPHQLSIDAIASTSHQLRRELLPIIMRGFIVKFPAWTPEFKIQCAHWIGDVSDLFCRCVDWVWLEGLYWRVSVVLGRDDEHGRRRPGVLGEDERARGRDVHMHEGSRSFEREAFVLRVDFQKSAEERALCCARQTVELLEKLLLGSDDGVSLGREQMGILLRETPLTGTEQHRVAST